MAAFPVFAYADSSAEDSAPIKNEEAKTGPATEQGPKKLKDVVVTADTIAEKGNGPVVGMVAKQSISATKTDTPILETPQTITVVTRDEMDERGVLTVNDAVRYVAGVQSENTGIDNRIDGLSIRGFDAGSFSGNSFMDGMRMPRGGQWTVPQFDAYALERVDVLKGPSAVLYGQIAPGGLINRVSKLPTAESRGEVSVMGGSFGTIQGAADASGPIDQKGKWMYRVVGLARYGAAEVDYTDSTRFYFSPSLTWAPNEDTTLTLLSQTQYDFGGSTYQFLTRTGTLRPGINGETITPSTFIGEPDWNTFDRIQTSLGYFLEHKFNDNLTARQNLRYSYVDSLYETVVSSGDALPNGNLNRRAVQGDGHSNGISVDNQLQGKLETGAVKHTLLGGLDYSVSFWEHTRLGATSVPPINIFNPVYSGAGTIKSTLTQVQSAYDTTEQQMGLYLQEQLQWENLHFTLGGRYDWFNTDQYNGANNATDVLRDEAFTWRAGVNYVFDCGIAPYVSYATSFQPVSGSDFYGNTFDPTEGEQYEVGIKYQPKEVNLILGASVYQLDQTNIVISDPDPAHFGFSSQMGKYRIRGVELEGRLGLLKGLDAILTYTYMNSDIKDGYVRSGASIIDVSGNWMPAVPEHMASLWLNYKFQVDGVIGGLSMGGGVRYVGESYGDQQNTFHVPSYTVFDLAARYNLGAVSSTLEGADLSLSVSNLFDKTYVASATSSASVHYGSGRTIYATLRYSW